MPTYPQKPPLTEDELRTFLDGASIAHLASMNPDGTIHIAALWFRHADGDLLFGTQDISNKVRNIKRNPAVTVLIDVEEPVLRGVLIYGHAQLDYEDVVAKRVAIFEKYMPRDDAQEFATLMADRFDPVIIRVTPDRLTSWDYAKAGMIQRGPVDAQ